MIAGLSLARCRDQPSVAGSSGDTMFHLQLFNVDARGRQVGLVHVGNPYPFASEAIADAGRLRLGTHFRITDEVNQLILEDRLLAFSEAVAAE